jgi:hypothetical protein
MREYALSYLFFCKKKRFDMGKIFLLSKMAFLMDAHAPPAQKNNAAAPASSKVDDASGCHL